MSYIYLPDPHPGRCECSRSGRAPNFEGRRCLGEEGHEGTCWFPPPAPPINQAWYGGLLSSTKTEPTPWVAPERPELGVDDTPIP